MPKGVEHLSEVVKNLREAGVRRPLMPKGVEHELTVQDWLIEAW